MSDIEKVPDDRKNVWVSSGTIAPVPHVWVSSGTTIVNIEKLLDYRMDSPTVANPDGTFSTSFSGSTVVSGPGDTVFGNYSQALSLGNNGNAMCVISSLAVDTSQFCINVVFNAVDTVEARQNIVESDLIRFQIYLSKASSAENFNLETIIKPKNHDWGGSDTLFKQELSLNKWYAISLVYDLDTLALFIDNKLISLHAFPDGLIEKQTEGNLYFGSDWDDKTDHFSGQLAAFQWYNGIPSDLANLLKNEKSSSVEWDITYKYEECKKINSFVIGARTQPITALSEIGAYIQHYENCAIMYPPRLDYQVYGTYIKNGILHYEAFEMHGPIYFKYKSLANPQLLGYLTCDESNTIKVRGRKSMFSKGGIYYSDNTGAQLVTDKIYAEYVNLGEPEVLGLPTADQKVITNGLEQEFQNCRFYYKNGDPKAFEVHGLILGTYLATGGVSKWGFPTANQKVITNGLEQEFENCRFYYKNGNPKAFEVHGLILDTYLATGGVSKWGFPTADQKVIANGLEQEFQNCRFYYKNGDPKAFEVNGRILDTYLATGGVSKWGFPTTDQKVIANGIEQEFQKCRFYYKNGDSKAFKVQDWILAKYLATGGVSSWGFPIEDQNAINHGLEQEFQKCRFYYNIGYLNAFEVHGLILEAYLATGGVSTWGFPIEDQMVIANGFDQWFQNCMFCYKNGDTKAFEVHGCILGPYLATGGVSKWGFPTANQKVITNGLEQEFQNCKFYYKNGDPKAFEVHGGILGTYLATGGVSTWGFPTADPYVITNGIEQVFQNCRFYYKNGDPKAFEVHGGILSTYLSTGGVSKWGFPTADQKVITNGLEQEFQNCKFYYRNGDPKAFEVHGLILGTYLATGGVSKWGFPTTDQKIIANGFEQEFQNCRFYNKNGDSKAFEVHGGILAKYLATGGVSTWGFPVSNESDVMVGNNIVGKYSEFENCTIYWSESTGAFEVNGDIRERYRGIRGPASDLGFPTSDEINIPNYSGPGRMNTFQKGSILWYGNYNSIVIARPFKIFIGVIDTIEQEGTFMGQNDLYIKTLQLRQNGTPIFTKKLPENMKSWDNKNIINLNYTIPQLITPNIATMRIELFIEIWEDDDGSTGGDDFMGKYSKTLESANAWGLRDNQGRYNVKFDYVKSLTWSII